MFHRKIFQNLDLMLINCLLI